MPAFSSQPNSVVLLGAMLLVLSVGCATRSAHGKTKVFVFAGQSNASGRADATQLPLELRVQEDVRYWYDTDRGSETRFDNLIPLGNQFGPEIEAGRVLSDALDDDIAFVKVAVGGTPLAQRSGTDWNVQSRNELYDRLVLNLQIAQLSLLAGGDEVELAGVFWMQGESDAADASRAAAYEQNLTEWIERFRTDFAEPELPFFIGKIKIGDGTSFVANGDRAFPYTPQIHAAQASLAESDANSYLIETDSFSLKDDLLHFDAQGQLDLGGAFARAYLEVVSIPEPTTLVSVVWVHWWVISRRSCQRRIGGKRWGAQ